MTVAPPQPWRSPVFALGPGGRRIAVAQGAGRIEVWDVASGAKSATLQMLPSATPQRGPSDWLVELPDGRFNASPGAPSHLRWRVEGKLLPFAAYDKALRDPAAVAAALGAPLAAR